MKNTYHFLIRGYKDTDSNKYLYWSNDDGWVDFDTATCFSRDELDSINFPMEATAISWITLDSGTYGYVGSEPLPVRK